MNPNDTDTKWMLFYINISLIGLMLAVSFASARLVSAVQQLEKQVAAVECKQWCEQKPQSKR